MILYFSGTGNSEYVAKRIAEKTDDLCVNLFDRIRARDFSAVRSDRPWVVVVPTYAWRIPRIVQEWLENTELAGNQKIYFVMTCGGGIGNAGKYLEKLCAAKNLAYLGCRAVVMPENYIALYSAPPREEALKIIRRAEPEIDRAARLIKGSRPFPPSSVALRDRVISGVVNRVFYPVVVHAKKFYVTDACISCGKCVSVCPLKNVRLREGKPLWGGRCTHCMACICRCPSGAIEYGAHSRGKTRYVCPKEI